MTPLLRIVCSVVPIASALALGGCALSGGVAPPVTPALVGAARGSSAEILGEGRRIYTGECASCHAPDPVGSYSPVEWEEIVGKMAPRARLDSAERAALLAYVQAASAQGR